MRLSIAGSPATRASRTTQKILLLAWCGALAIPDQACNVYTPDLLRSGVGGAGAASSGGRGFGGTGVGGRILGNGGIGPGGTVAGNSGDSGGSPNAGSGGSSGEASGGSSGEASGGFVSAPGGSAGQTVLPLGGSATGGSVAGGSATGGSVIGGGNGGIGGSAGGSSSIGGATGVGGSVIACDRTVVDAMQDANAAIAVCDGRNGTWYSFGTDPSLVPVPGGTFTKQQVSPADEATIGTKFEAKLTGSATPSDCGMGFTLSVKSNGTKNTYSLAGKKLRFHYRTTGFSANSSLSLAVPLATTTPTAEGGTCVSPCYNHYSYLLQPSTGWLIIEVPLTAAASPGFAQNVAWGKNIVPWDPSLALTVQFTVSGLSSAYVLEVGPIELIE